jgi:hypothetical protein
MKLQSTFGKITGTISSHYGHRGDATINPIAECPIIANIAALTPERIKAALTQTYMRTVESLFGSFVFDSNTTAGSSELLRPHLPRRDSIVGMVDPINVSVSAPYLRLCKYKKDTSPECPKTLLLPDAELVAYNVYNVEGRVARTDYIGARPWEQEIIKQMRADTVSTSIALYSTDYGFLWRLFVDQAGGSRLQEVKISKDSVSLVESRWRTDENGQTVRFGSRRVHRDVATGLIKEVDLRLVKEGEKTYYNCGKTIYKKIGKSTGIGAQVLKLLYLSAACRRRCTVRRAGTGETIEYTQRRRFTESRSLNKSSAVITDGPTDLVGMRSDVCMDLRSDGENTTLSVVMDHPDMYVERNATMLLSNHPDMNFWKMITTENVFSVREGVRSETGLHTFSSSYCHQCLPLFIALGYDSNTTPMAFLHCFLAIHANSSEYLLASSHCKAFQVTDTCIRYVRGIYSDSYLPSTVVGKSAGCINVNPWLAPTNSDDSYELSNFVFLNIGKNVKKVYSAFSALHTNPTQKNYKLFLVEAMAYYEEYAKGYLRCLAAFSNLTDHKGSPSRRGIRTYCTPFISDMFSDKKVFVRYAGVLDAYVTDINVRSAEDYPKETVGCAELELIL